MAKDGILPFSPSLHPKHTAIDTYKSVPNATSEESPNKPTTSNRLSALGQMADSQLPGSSKLEKAAPRSTSHRRLTAKSDAVADDTLVGAGHEVCAGQREHP